MSSELLLLIGISFSLGFTPGPNNAVASYSAFNFGFKKTIPLIMGVGFGYTVLVILINFVLISVFKEYPIIQEIIRILGTIFLIYLAYKIATADVSNDESKRNPVTFYDTFIFQFINPKGVMAAITLISKFVDQDNMLVGIEVLKGVVDESSDDSYRQVDGISGATITSKGLETFLLDDLKKYEPYFKNNWNMVN